MLFDHKPSHNNELSIHYIIVNSTIYIVENSFSLWLWAFRKFKKIASKKNKYINYEFTLEKISFVFCRNGIDTKNKQQQQCNWKVEK